MPRLFLGTYLSNEQQLALGQLPALNQNLEAEWNCRIRWSKQNQLHLTWIFFGNLDAEKIASLCEKIEGSCGTCSGDSLNLSITYDTLECWLNHDTPSLIALAPDTVSSNFLDFAKNLRLDLSSNAATDVREQVQKDFKPHITLTRLSAINNGKPKLPLTDTNKLPLSAIAGLTNLVPLVQTIGTISL